MASKINCLNCGTWYSVTEPMCPNCFTANDAYFGIEAAKEDMYGKEESVKRTSVKKDTVSKSSTNIGSTNENLKFVGKFLLAGVILSIIIALVLYL